MAIAFAALDSALGFSLMIAYAIYCNWGSTYQKDLLLGLKRAKLLGLDLYQEKGEFMSEGDNRFHTLEKRVLSSEGESMDKVMLASTVMSQGSFSKPYEKEIMARNLLLVDIDKEILSLEKEIQAKADAKAKSIKEKEEAKAAYIQEQEAILASRA